MRTPASEEFAARLEPALRRGAAASARSGDATPADEQDEQDTLVALAVGLRDAARPLAGTAPRQEFRTALAERLADEARELAPSRRKAATLRGPRRQGAGTDRATPRPRRLRGVLAAAAALVVAGGAGAAVASEDALPGSTLYPLKRQVEDLRLQLSSPGSDRGATELALARERLAEAEALALESGGADAAGTDTPELRGVLADFRSSALAGIRALTEDYARTGDATSLAAVDTFLDETLPLLERVRRATPASVHPVVDDLRSVLVAGQADLARTVASCAECADLGVVVAVPATTAPTGGADPTSPTSGAQPGGAATVAPGSPSTAPTAGAGGEDGDAPLPDPLPSAPGTVVEDVLPPLPSAPSASAPGTTTDPPAPLPTVTVSASVSVPPVLPTSSCALPVGCP